MFDYKLLSALAAVAEQGSFDRAAQVLGLSQSAVSQRIKLLEARTGQPVLIRGTPTVPSEIGQRLLHHVQQVRLLERDLHGQLPQLDEETVPDRLRIALSADSLSTWWAAAVGEFCVERGLLLDLVVVDQEVGLNRMRSGDVAACLCSSERSVAGTKSVLLGHMRYRPIASPAFVARHFPQGFDIARLARAPALVYGPDDLLQQRYMAEQGIEDYLHHLCPSSQGFVQMAEAGISWGLIPEMQVKGQLAAGTLVDINPDGCVDVAMYWHHWRQGGKLLADLTAHLVRHAGALLQPIA
ncbi:transcriptional regulator ArgP [Pseudomonas putida]|uniref:Transcriptional regulator ArgP n=1 Tax=Pseudomonas putida TaxID=303 RepID=A0A2S3WUF3_PSEPU|nr:LysR family transcriptional regulator ArgP [Pseudomonas putida]POG04935.1 transcriptional regulator ArgP [Pseudomonas putida]POG07669.1 transcriptional regulator ArgP [Pseudomonas putida]